MTTPSATPQPNPAASEAMLWIDPGFGVSGDMMLGALGGLMTDPYAALAPLRDLGLTRQTDARWTVEFTTADRNGLASSRAIVDAPPSEHGRTWSSIDTLIERAVHDERLPPGAGAGARHTFRRLAEIEAGAHGVTIDEVHFHEVGALDAIVDIVGSWLLYDALGLDPSRTVCGAFGLGHGTVSAAHGELPVPAPATLALLGGWETRPVATENETCTPTGAALATTMASASGPMPAGVIRRNARGAGGRNPTSHPNIVRAVLLDRPNSADQTARAEGDVIVETNVDDVTPETIGYVIDRALELGADDAWAVPIVMKKSRPAHQLRILTAATLAPAMRELLTTETGTLGTRSIPVDKIAVERSIHKVEVRGHTIAIKVGPYRAKPEHEDVARTARQTGMPLRVIADEALAVWNRVDD